MEQPWQTVNRRRRSFPENWKTTVAPRPTVARPFAPYQASPTYAQVLLRPPPTIRIPSALRSPTPSPPTSPNSSTPAEYYVSPQSPTTLRFPTTFRCCRRGHTKAACRSHLRCRKCWHEGHVGTYCRAPRNPVPPQPNPTSMPLNPTTPQFHPAGPPARQPATHQEPKPEPNFDDLLTGAYPTAPPEMPEGRPAMVHCYIPKEEEHFKELERLEQGVILHSFLDFELTIDTVAKYVARTGLVKPLEVSVGVLPRGKYLIMLPKEINREEFIRSTPFDLWDFGYEFQPWSPHDEASIVIPYFKVLVHLYGLPVYLWKETHAMNAVSSFGTYLGSITRPEVGKFDYWAAVVATEDLAHVPHIVSIRIGGLEHIIEVKPIKWVHNLIYQATDLPPAPKRFTTPSPPTPDSSSDAEMGWDNTERIPMSIKVLKEVCKGRELDSLPEELREVLAGEEGFTQSSNTEGNMAIDAIADLGIQQSPDIMHPQLERLRETTLVIEGNNTAIQRATATIDPNMRQPSQRRQILLRSADHKLKGICSESETGQDERGMQLATESHGLLDLTDITGEGPRPCVAGQNKGKQIGESPQKPFPRTTSHQSHIKVRDSLPHAEAPLLLAGQSENFINSPDVHNASNRPQRNNIGSISRGNIPSREKGCLASRKKAPTTSNSGPKPNAVSNGLNVCLQILSQETSPSILKRKSMGRILIPNRPEPAKKHMGTGQTSTESPVQANLTPDGYFNVRVQQAYCGELGLKCGFKSRDVAGVLQEDNMEQANTPRNSAGPSERNDTEDEITPGRFDPDSADEFESEEE